MATSADRDKLLRFLDQKVFDPILSTSAREVGDDSELREKLSHVKRNTASEKRRFHDDYRTAEEVRDNYLSDLHSRTAERVNKELESLGLPRLPDVKRDFVALCSRLGVGPS